MIKHRVVLEIDPADYGLQPGPKELKRAYDLLSEVYGVLWTNASYDPDSQATKIFSAPLFKKMSEANEILGFKK